MAVAAADVAIGRDQIKEHFLAIGLRGVSRCLMTSGKFSGSLAVSRTNQSCSPSHVIHSDVLTCRAAFSRRQPLRVVSARDAFHTFVGQRHPGRERRARAQQYRWAGLVLGGASSRTVSKWLMCGFRLRPNRNNTGTGRLRLLRRVLFNRYSTRKRAAVCFLDEVSPGRLGVHRRLPLRWPAFPEVTSWN
jgi:hypothetical protein